MEQPSDVLAKLEAAIDAWSAQVNDAQRGLTEGLDRARGQMDGDIDLRDTLKGHSAELAALREMLGECCEAARMTLKRVNHLETKAADLRRDLDALRSSADESGWISGRFDALLPELRRLADTLGRGGDDALAEALRRRDEAVKELTRLQGELDAMRGSLRELAPVAESDDEPAVDLALEPTDPDGARRRMGEILVHAGLITIEQLQLALDAQARQPHRRLGAILLEKGFVNEDMVAQVLAGQLGMPFYRLGDVVIEPNAPRLIGSRVARQHLCIPISATDDTLVLAMANPLNLIAIEDVELASGRRVESVVARESDIARAIDRYYLG